MARFYYSVALISRETAQNFFLGKLIEMHQFSCSFLNLQRVIPTAWNFLAKIAIFVAASSAARMMETMGKGFLKQQNAFHRICKGLARSHDVKAADFH